MTLPNSIDVSTPSGTDSPGLGDDQIRALKTFLEDLFGIPDATSITAAVCSITAGGLVTLAPVIQGYTKAGLPAAGTANRLARVTDDIRGFWIDTGTQWKSITGYADVTDFGANPDGGVTDNATPFTNAMTGAGAGGKVFIPEGDNYYGFATGITINLQNLTLEGQGDRSMLVNLNTGGQNLITVTGAQGVVLRSFSMSGATASGHGIYLTGGAYRGFMEDIFCRSIGQDCVRINDALGWTIIHPRFSVNIPTVPFDLAGSTTARNGIKSDHSNGGTLTIIGPLIEGLALWGVDIAASSLNTVILGGTIEGNGTSSGGNIRTAGFNTSIIGVDVEVGGTVSTITVTGAKSTLIENCVGAGGGTSGLIEVINSIDTIIRNYRGDSITIDSASKRTRLENISYGNNGGGITDDGLSTYVGQIYNGSNENMQLTGKGIDSHVNFVRNGGFERWVSATSLDAPFAGGFAPLVGATVLRTGDGESDTTKKSGHYAVKVTAAASTISGIRYQGFQPALADILNKTLTWSVWAKAVTGTTNIRLRISVDGGATDATFMATTTWQKFSASFPFTTGAGYSIDFHITEASKEVYLDNMYITVGSKEQYDLWDNIKTSEPEPTGHTNLTFSATPTIYGDVATLQAMTLTGNITGITLANWIPGLPIWLKFLQDGTGGRTVGGWPTVKWAGGSAPVITVTADKADMICLVFDGTDYWDCGLRQNL